MIGCHLVEERLMGPKALTRMVKLWPGVSPDKRHRYPCSPQTSEQETYVPDWIPATKIDRNL
jgi:hypothetical protein